jgi:serine/threonine protein kinase
MLSPLASCNLKEYWKKTQPQLGESAFVLWELTQLRGLADGVRYIYNLGGWHHDLKGENILVFEEGNRGGPTLQIADFGSAKIRARRSGPRDESSPTNNYSQGTSAYEAPDYVIRGETSRPYDVWTLGCIFMDMLVWTFGTRPSELETFSDERRQLKGGKLSTDTMFWYVEPGGKNCTTHWKPYVRKRLRELEDQCDSKKGRAVFKELVLTTKKMLRMDPSARPKAYEVHNDLERMTLWAEEALKDPKWNIQNLVIGALPSTAKSETSGELDGDGVPVIAPLGHLMIGNVAILETPRPVNKLLQRRLRDGTDLNFMGSHENLLLRANDSNSFNLVVDDVENMSDNSTHRRNNQAERPLYGSHWISPDRDAFGEARTAVASAAASELHLQGPGNL